MHAAVVGLFFLKLYQVKMVNYWKESIFSLAIYFRKLPNHDICQVNFSKLLEMLSSRIMIVWGSSLLCKRHFLN